MFTSFSTALSALSAHSTAVDVVGNNLANLNTPGFKSSVVAFRDLVTQSLGAGLGETQVGFGTARPLTLRQFTQGAIQSSTGLLDIAVQGDGFFVTKNASGAMLFTRTGNFQTDDDGKLVTLTGEKVQGWTLDASGNVDPNGPLGDLVVPIGTLSPAVATTACSVDVNLNAASKAGDAFSTPVEVWDSLGISHVLTLTFTRSDTANQWDYSVTIPGAEVGVPDEPAHELASGSLTFDETGRLSTPAADDDPLIIDVTGLTSSAADLKVTWDLYNSNGIPHLTQFGQPSAKSANSQNGSGAATLIRVGLADGGKVLAQYSNGQQEVVGQLALASIRNPESLIAVGNSNFQSSARTAMPAIGMPDTGGRGSLIGGALESSTVDIAREFTNLIVFQRGYQANSRVITTVDELSQETINLKR